MLLANGITVLILPCDFDRCFVSLMEGGELHCRFVAKMDGGHWYCCDPVAVEFDPAGEQEITLDRLIQRVADALASSLNPAF